MSNNQNNNTILQMKKINVIQAKDMKISLYDQIKTGQDIGRIFTKKTPHSLDKILKQTNSSNLSTTNHINDKKMISNYSLNNIQSSPEINKSLNYSLINNRQNSKKDYSINTTIQDSPSFSKINNRKIFEDNNQTNAQVKERLIQNLKTNFSQDKIRKKKMLSVNVNPEYSYINNPERNYTVYDADGRGTTYKPSIYHRNPEQPLKLHTHLGHGHKNDGPNYNVNLTTLINNNGNISFNNNDVNSNFAQASSNNSQNDSVSCHSKKLSNNNINVIFQQNLYDIELKLDRMLKDNKTNSKSKKYNAIKVCFEEYIKIASNDQQKLLKKFLMGYHEVVSAFFTENRTLKEKNECLQNKSLALEKSSFDSMKIIKQKENEIELFKKKLAELEKMSIEKISKDNNIIIPDQSCLDQSIVKSLDNTKDHYITNINKSNVEDLDALYFYNKINMQSDSDPYSKVPKLDLTFGREIRGRSIDAVKVTKKYSYIKNNN